MGLGSKRGKMWAGIMDDHIATDDKSTDEYTPISIALFPTKAEAERHYQCVVQIDVDEMLRTKSQKQKVR